MLLKYFVPLLQTTINNTGCGTEQLCAAEPASCNPSVAGSCFFLSARQTSGQNFEFGLAGEADGYIAATLSTDSTLVCQVLSQKKVPLSLTQSESLL